MSIKLNIGASPMWRQDGWHALDHKIKKSTDTVIAGDAANISISNESCDVVFCSHVFEHIPHTQLPLVLSEINRILKPNGILRILTPDLEKIATAYVKKDKEFFDLAKEEDESLRTDLGYGGMLVNFIVSPGQDTVLISRSLDRFIAGYAHTHTHIYIYDYPMLKIIMNKLGFTTRKAIFCDSDVKEMQVPLHVIGLESRWQNFNRKEFLEALPRGFH